MARIQYVVSYRDGQWYIVVQGNRHGPYNTQEDAINDAVGAARQTPNSQVLVQGANSQFRTEWTYGDDPYPPAG